MSDTNTSPTRVKASERKLFAGTEESNYTEADRAVYLIPANGRSVEYVFGTNPIADKALAFFGFHTKIGNVANTVRNDKEAPGTPDDEADAIDSWFAGLVNDGQWREPGEVGARGPKYDDDLLAEVIHTALTAAGAAKGDVAHYREKLNDKGYRTKVIGAAMGGKLVKDLYAEAAKAKGLTVDRPARDLGDLA